MNLLAIDKAFADEYFRNYALMQNLRQKYGAYEEGLIREIPGKWAP